MHDYSQGSFAMPTQVQPSLGLDVIDFLDRDALANLEGWYRDLAKQ